MQAPTHPLVVFVVFDFVGAVDVANNAGLHEIAAGQTDQPIRNGERTVDPAIRVHNAQRNLVDDAVDRVADVLP